MQRCDALGAISDEPDRLTRTFHSPAMQRANALVGEWMREAGLVREDAAFNLIGRWPSLHRGGRTRTRTLLIGSHLDTVRDAGKYDGPLGVLTALAAVQHLRERGGQTNTLPFDVEVVGFSDEEGVRYQTMYLGSGAMAGTLSRAELARIDEKGVARARRRRGELVAYVEAHIEQGPVLEARGLPLGVVSAISGQSRLRVDWHGLAGHAGTTPMDLRRDALCGAAEFVLAVERCGVIATIGQLTAEPGASNVIPGNVSHSLDVRHPQDARRRRAVTQLHTTAKAIARRRGLRLTWTTLTETNSVRCDPRLTRLLTKAIIAQGLEVATLPSGAGHDAAAMSTLCPVAMLFVRCRGGVSHNPAESIKPRDAERAIAALASLIADMPRLAT
jgi:allantoate deiminase